MPVTSRQKPSESRPVFSGLPLVLLVMAAIGGAFMMVPRDGELLDRLVKDGDHARALELVGQRLGVERSDETSLLLERLLLEAGNHAGRDFHAEAIAFIRLTNQPSHVNLLLERHASAFTPPQLAEAREILARRALELGEPALAATLFQQAWPHLDADLDLLELRIAACRYAGRPQAALDAISEYLRDHRLPFSQLPDGLRETSIVLHREVNDGAHAFDLVAEEYEHSLKPEERERLMKLLMTTASEGGRTADSLGILQRHVATADAVQTPWRRLANPNRHAAANDATFLEYAPLLAQRLEWTGRSAEAFDYYLKLAALGDGNALERCLTIYPWIGAQAEVTDLLEMLVPIEERPDYTLLLGRLEAVRCNLELAEKHYRTWLAGNPEDALAWRDLGDIHDAGGRFEDAIEAYQKAIDLDVSMVDLHRNIANLRLALEDFPGALQAFRALPAGLHDLKSLDDYSLLADSLGSSKEVVHALQLKLAATESPALNQYQEIADTWIQLGDLEMAASAGIDGLKAFPGSVRLRLLLADVHHLAGRSNEAFDLLLATGAPDDHRVAAQVLSLAYSTGRFEEARNFLDPEGKGLNTAVNPIEVAELYEATGETGQALAIYLSVPEGEPEAARIRASRAFGEGDLKSAIAYQKRYLDTTSSAHTHDGWLTLGDMLRAAGDTHGAEIAYRRALLSLKSAPVIEGPPGDGSAELKLPIPSAGDAAKAQQF